MSGLSVQTVEFNESIAEEIVATDHNEEYEITW